MSFASQRYPVQYLPDYEVPPITPLCQELYYRLLRRYPGGVKIANMHEEMTGRLQQGVSGPHWVVMSWGETYRINCPFCNDSRHRLWLPHRFGQPDPANHNRRGNFYGVCFNEDCLREPGNRDQLYMEVFGVRNRDVLHNPPVISQGERYDGRLREATWPGQVIPMVQLDQNHPAVLYLHDRGFNHGTMRNYGLVFCTAADDRYRAVTNRIVAPFVQLGKMVGWQGRYVGEPLHKSIPKYYTDPHMPKRNVLYNHDRSKDHDFVAVFEGITDVWRFGDPGVALCGKTMSTGQRLLLQQSWPGKPIIICLDPEARDESAGMVYELKRANTNPVVDVQLEQGWDPADYSTEALWNIIRSRAMSVGVELPE